MIGEWFSNEETFFLVIDEGGPFGTQRTLTYSSHGEYLGQSRLPKDPEKSGYKVLGTWAPFPIEAHQ